MGLTAEDFFEVGKPLDAVIYNGESPLLTTAETEHLLPTLLYTADGASVSGTIVDGEWIVRDARHKHENEILRDFQKVMKAVSRQ